MISLFPELIEAASSYGVLGRAISRELVDVELVNPRAFAADKHNTVDDRPYGGGPGMVMMVEPLRCALEQAQQGYLTAAPGRQPLPVIYLSPGGERLNQTMVSELAELPGMILKLDMNDGQLVITATEVDLKSLADGSIVVSGSGQDGTLNGSLLYRVQPGSR